MEETPIIILYDGNCPICCRKRDFLKKRDPKGILDFSNIRSSDFQAEKTGTSFSELETKIHALLPDGSLVNRMNAIRVAYRAIGLDWIIAPTGWPIFRQIFDCLYDFVAKHRIFISRFIKKKDNLER